MKVWEDIKTGDHIYMLKWHAKNSWLEIRRCHVNGIRDVGEHSVKIEFGHCLNKQDKGLDWMKREYLSMFFNKKSSIDKEDYEKKKPTYLFLAEFNEEIVSNFEKVKRNE